MDTQFVRISDLPLPAEARQDHAFNYHVHRFQRWLSTAGASPRVAVALCPEDEQLQDLINALESKDIKVEQTFITESRPIPEPVLRHQGDHFNRTLFVVSGLTSEGDTGGLLSRLDGYVEHYAKVATWVLFVVKDAPTLVQFAEGAPKLWERVGRCVPVAGSVTLHAEVDVKRRWSHVPRLEYACTVLNGLGGMFAPNYHQWSRLCRVGYAHRLSGDAHIQGANLQSLWYQPDAFGEQIHGGDLDNELPPWIDEAYTRHGHRGSYPWFSPQWSRIEDRYLIKQLSAFHTLFKADQMPTKAEIESFRENYALQTSPDLRIEACFVDAQLYAQTDDLDGMLNAFDAAVTVADRASLEAAFEAFYRIAEVFVLLERHTDARRCLDRLGEFETQLMSPMYEARFLLLKGRFLLGLDALKGTEILADAYRLFAAHGYPDYTAQVQELTSKVP